MGSVPGESKSKRKAKVQRKDKRNRTKLPIVEELPKASRPCHNTSRSVQEKSSTVSSSQLCSIGQEGNLDPSLGKKRQRETITTCLNHPFPTEYGDHFETPLQAYRDVEDALALLAKKLGKRKKNLRIWDPYYCAGRTPRLLAQLGFHKVEHRNEDFYRVIRDGKQPVYDVLVTNPPYSGEHKRRCLEYCKESGKPWFLLIPNYVATKDYYKANMLGPSGVEGGEPFYVVPRSSYLFDHPEGTGHAESPFFGVWFVHCGSHNEEIFRGLKAQSKGTVSILRTLEDLAARGAIQTTRRPNPRQRKKMKRKRDAAHDK